MRGSKDIMESMMDGNEYVNAMMPIEVYHQINNNLQEQMSITVRRKNSHYESDETYKDLANKSAKANRKLRDYEFILNNK